MCQISKRKMMISSASVSCVPEGQSAISSEGVWLPTDWGKARNKGKFLEKGGEN